jgi:hypothetical protein
LFWPHATRVIKRVPRKINDVFIIIFWKLILDFVVALYTFVFSKGEQELVKPLVLLK